MFQPQPQNTPSKGAPVVTESKLITDGFKARQEQFSKLEQSLQKIPGHIAKIETTPKKGDEVTTFVVIREMHVSNQLPDLKPKAMQCQAELNAVISTLLPNLGNLTVFKDGMHGSIAQSFNDRIKDLYQHAGTVATLEKAFSTQTSKQTDVALKALQKEGADTKKINIIKFLKEYQEMREGLYEDASVDAVVNLALRRSISLVGPEDKELVNQTLKIAKDNPLIEVDDPRLIELGHKREAHVVSKVAESGRHVVIGVFGGSHDFSNEVDDWNKKNPNKRIALVEITPAEYEKNFGLEK